jgi:hypothetical protein
LILSFTVLSEDRTRRSVRIPGYYVRICGDIGAVRDRFGSARDKKFPVGAAAMTLGVCAGRVKKLLGRRVTIVARPLMASAGRLLLAVWAVAIVAVQSMIGSAAPMQSR